MTAERDQNVLRRYVTVHDAQRMSLVVGQLVGSVQTCRDARSDECRQLARDALVRRGVQQVAERRAVRPLHHEKMRAAFFAQLVGGAHAGVIDARG